MTTNQVITCTNCHTALDVQRALDHCTTGWIPQKWLYFRFPACREYAHIGITKDTLSIGGIDGAPGPCFFPHASVAASGIAFNSRGRISTVCYGGRTWRFKSR